MADLFDDFYVTKIDKDGHQNWQSSLGSIRKASGAQVPYREMCRSIDIADDGDLIMAGHRFILGGPLQSLIVRTDPMGNVRWARTFDDSVAYSIKSTTDGGFAISGEVVASGARRVFLTKLDRDGLLKWRRIFGGFESRGRDVLETQSGGFLVIGFAGDADKSMYLAATDAEGHLQWERQFVGKGRAQGLAAQLTKDGNYVVAGSTTSRFVIQDCGYLLKINPNGNTLWEKTICLKEPYQFGVRSVKETQSGGFILAGGFDNGPTIDRYTDFGDMWLVKTDADGTEEWRHSFGGKYDDSGLSVSTIAGEGYAMTGFTTTDQRTRKIVLLLTDANGRAR